MKLAVRAPVSAHALLIGHGGNAAVFAGGALMTTYLGFEQGGFFPGTTAIATLAVAVCLVVRVVAARRPFEGFGWQGAAAISALALFSVLTLLSSAWSHAPGRAVIEFNRVLLYLAVLVLFASLPRDDGKLAALAGGFALATVVLCGAGLATRALPGLFPIAPSENTGRLGYPLTYRNALGLTAVLGMLVCLGLSGAQRLPGVFKSLAAAGIPLLAATLLLSFSRGPMVAGLGALVVMVLITRTRSLAAALLAGIVGAVPAIAAAYSATALAQTSPTGPAAVSQGHELVLVVALSCLGAGVVRIILTRWEARPSRRMRLSLRRRRIVALVALLVALGGGGAGAAALDLPHQISRQYHQFVVGVRLPANVPLRDRLLNIGNNGRLPLWRVAVNAWRSQPFHGHGAGTYQELWDHNRPRSYAIDVVNAHSLYLEVLAELGVIGLLPLVGCLLAILVSIARRMRSADRGVTAGLVAALSCWLVHAGVDWDWQIPANSWWIFAAGGLCLARVKPSVPSGVRLGQWRRLLMSVAIGVIALLPLQVELSQASLTRAVTALGRDNCRVAVSDALQSASDLSARAEPYEILGYCDARYGFRSLSLTMIRSAIDHDPGDWEYRYDLALVRGLGGLDPRRAAATALKLNPLSPVTAELSAAFRSSNPRIWRARARKAPLLVP